MTRRNLASAGVFYIAGGFNSSDNWAMPAATFLASSLVIKFAQHVVYRARIAVGDCKVVSVAVNVREAAVCHAGFGL